MSYAFGEQFFKTKAIGQNGSKLDNGTKFHKSEGQEPKEVKRSKVKLYFWKGEGHNSSNEQLFLIKHKGSE